MMKLCVSLLTFFVIFQFSIAASKHDPKQGISVFAEENEDAPIVSSQRSAVEFGLMILCHVDKNPLDYNGYGCFCGLGGKGEPKDDTDRCCQIHDQCYTNVQESESCPFDSSIYVIPYSRKNCYLCEPADYYWFYGECRNALCECDSEAVQCFKRAKSTFNSSLKSYPKETC